MPYNTKALKNDSSGQKPVPQAFNVTLDDFEALLSTLGRMHTLLYSMDGTTPLLTTGGVLRTDPTGTTTQPVADATLTARLPAALSTDGGLKTALVHYLLGENPATLDFLRVAIAASTQQTGATWTLVRDLQTTVVTVTSAPCVLYAVFGYAVSPVTDTVSWIQVFNTTGAVTLGTTQPQANVPVLLDSATTPMPPPIPFPSCGVNITAGLKIAATTQPDGVGAPGTGLDALIIYK